MSNLEAAIWRQDMQRRCDETGDSCVVAITRCQLLSQTPLMHSNAYRLDCHQQQIS